MAPPSLLPYEPVISTILECTDPQTFITCLRTCKTFNSLARPFAAKVYHHVVLKKDTMESVFAGVAWDRLREIVKARLYKAGGREMVSLADLSHDAYQRWWRKVGAPKKKAIAKEKNSDWRPFDKIEALGQCRVLTADYCRDCNDGRSPIIYAFAPELFRAVQTLRIVDPYDSGLGAGYRDGDNVFQDDFLFKLSPSKLVLDAFSTGSHGINWTGHSRYFWESEKEGIPETVFVLPVHPTACWLNLPHIRRSILSAANKVKCRKVKIVFTESESAFWRNIKSLPPPRSDSLWGQMEWVLTALQNHHRVEVYGIRRTLVKHSSISARFPTFENHPNSVDAFDESAVKEDDYRRHLRALTDELRKRVQGPAFPAQLDCCRFFTIDEYMQSAPDDEVDVGLIKEYQARQIAREIAKETKEREQEASKKRKAGAVEDGEELEGHAEKH